MSGKIGETVEDQILDAWVRQEPTRTIMDAHGITSSRNFHKIIESARLRSDPRAVYRNGSHKSKRPSRQKERPQKPKIEGGRVDGWWFAKKTVAVPRIGAGSVQCSVVEVSLSCIPDGGFDDHDFTRVSRPIWHVDMPDGEG